MTTPITSTFAKESSHWYARDGSPAYTLTGKNGKERNTTLRDARELGLVPSVTTIIRMAAAPALEKWKRNQVLLAALTLPRMPDESEQDWLKRVEQDWQEQGRAAADRGTAIHGAIEQHYRGEIPEFDLHDWVMAAKYELASLGEQPWNAERSFAFGGYGGKTDLHSPEWVIDVKTKDGNVHEGELSIWDEHAMQLSAYRRGLGVNDAKCGILYVGRDVPSAKLIQLDEPALVKGLAMFDALLAYWYAKTQLSRP